MKLSVVILVGVCILQDHQINGKSKKRWIPERYSDDDFGMDFAPSQSSFDTSQQSGQSQNPYQQKYSSYYFRANDNPNHMMLDPVQQLNDVQAYSYAQTFQNPYLAPYRPGPGGPPNMPAELQVGADHSPFFFQPQQSQPQMFYSPQQGLVQQSPSPVFVMQSPSASSANMFQPAVASPMIFFMPGATQNTQGAYPMFASPAAGHQVVLAETFQQSQPAGVFQALPANQQMFFFPYTASFGSNANVFAAPMVETAQVVEAPFIVVTNDQIVEQDNSVVEVVGGLTEGVVEETSITGAEEVSEAEEVNDAEAVNAAEEVIVEDQKNIQYGQTEEAEAVDEVVVEDVNAKGVVNIEEFAANAQNVEEVAESEVLVDEVEANAHEVETNQEYQPSRQQKFEDFLAAFKKQKAEAESSKVGTEEVELKVKDEESNFHNVNNQAKGLHSRAYSYHETPSPAPSYGPTSGGTFYNPMDVIYPGVNSPGQGYHTTVPIYYNPEYTTPSYLQQQGIYNPYSPPQPLQYTGPITNYGSAIYRPTATYSPTSYASSGNAAYTYPGQSQSSVSTVPTTTYGGSYYEQLARDTRSPLFHSGNYYYGVQMPRVG